ncbi:MAG TPA: hypothetical protein VEB21_16265 [Terriglobales bacterium]|nr:hypothetical protein [Terriglobales bacterium]
MRSMQHPAARLALRLLSVLAVLASADLAAAQLCGAAPASCVYSSNFSRLHMENERFLWKYRRGNFLASDAGDPVNSTDYAVCIYADGALVDEMAIPHGGQCRKRACWKKLQDRGFVYLNPEGTDRGINWVKIKLGDKKAIMKIKGRGDKVQFPLPITPASAVTMQMVNSDGKCWEAIFPVPWVKSTSDKYIDASGFLTHRP